ncbi:Htur_1727 family rSAM-partnered candidate RiPP [Halobaculum gomorrense]|uniref:RSAM-partnered protein, Htur_1727 family n=1 Tax=Halobaculum gomorrense TaxID=43928 RepID=A0A1M5NMX2_9EURY|nr:Htur_1727 family rSAM-partnered candidate RiPP [Halobaculum gomorrense]SHG90795.1 rSAM-partnered protein, Htur_1727 family [Halobaculum gomorrense]
MLTDSDQRTRVDAARADGSPEWEAFLRESASDPLRHAGSVTAPSIEVAHDQASTLCPDALTLWLVCSDRVARFAERDLGAEYEVPGEPTESAESADSAAAAADSSAEQIRERKQQRQKLRLAVSMHTAMTTSFGGTFASD